MRILTIVFIFLGVIVIFFVLIGVLSPQFEYTNEVVIHAPQEKCWKELLDSNTMSKWMDGYESLKITQGEHLTPGGTYELIINSDGERMVMSQVIIAIDAPSLIQYELTNDVMLSDYTYSLSELKGQTIVKSTYTIHGNSIFWCSVLRLSKGYLETEGQKQIQKFKAFVESTTN